MQMRDGGGVDRACVHGGQPLGPVGAGIAREAGAGVMGEAPAEVLEEAVVTSQLWRSLDGPASVAFGAAGDIFSVVQY